MVLNDVPCFLGIKNLQLASSDFLDPQKLYIVWLISICICFLYRVYDFYYILVCFLWDLVLAGLPG